MAEKQIEQKNSPTNDEGGEISEEIKKIDNHTSDESGRATGTEQDKSSRSTPQTSGSTSGIEMKYDHNPDVPDLPELEVEPASESSDASSKQKSAKKSPFKSIKKSVVNVFRKVSPSRPEKKGESSKSPKGTEGASTSGKSPQKSPKKSFWKRSPKKHAAPGEDEPFLEGDELKGSSSDEQTGPKSPKQLGVTSKKHHKSPKKSPKKDKNANKHIEKEDKKKTGKQKATASEKRAQFAGKVPADPEIGEWGPVRLTVDTDWSRTTLESEADELTCKDTTEQDVHTTGERMSRNLGLTEHEEAEGISCKKLEKPEAKSISVSPGKRKPLERQMHVECPDDDLNILPETTSSPSKQPTRSEGSQDSDYNDKSEKDESKDDLKEKK